MGKKKSGHGRQNEDADACEATSQHEKAAESIVHELRDKDGVFHFTKRKESLNQVGIDWVLGRNVKVGKHTRELRIHIQHKANEHDANYFSNLNPCIPVWEHHVSAHPIDGKINLLKLVVIVLKKANSPHTDFFEEKLREFEHLKRRLFK